MPWGISHKYRFIFIHIPKTAGTTICSSWEGSLLKKICKETGILGGTHKSAMDLKQMFPKEFDKYFKFAVIRNPFDRFVSKFYFKQLNPRKNFDLEWTDKEAEGLLPQMYWITDRTCPDVPTKDPYFRHDTHYGNVIVNGLLRYENIDNDLKYTFKKLNMHVDYSVMPHFRQTRSVGDYRRYYDEKMKSLVTYLYREDLKRLNYRWIGQCLTSVADLSASLGQ